jgi:hypothetical protein
MKTRSLSLIMELGSPWRRTKSWPSSHATLLAAAPRSLPRPLPCASRATAHARKCASTHSSVGHLRIPSPTCHCILLLHTHMRDLAFLCHHCHQAHLIAAPPLRTTRAAAKGLNGSTLAPQCFLPNLITRVPPPPLHSIRRRPVSPLLPSSSKSYPRSWHTLLTSPSFFLMIGSRRPPLKTSHRGWARRSSLCFHLRAPKLPRVPMELPEHRELTSPPPRRSPPSATAMPVRMSCRPSPRLPGASLRARLCHVGPSSPTDVVVATLVTSCLPGSRS